MSRPRLGALATAVLLALSLAPPAAAADPHIVDAADDANLLGLPHIPGGQARSSIGDETLDNDPFGGGVSTGPASYAPADILAVEHETTYEAVPIGADGIDYRTTGLRIRIETAEPFAAPPGRPILLSAYLRHRDEWGTLCRTTLNLSLDEGDGPGVYPLEWFHETQFESWCPRVTGPYTDAGWTATVTESPAEVVMELPFSTLDDFDRSVVDEGRMLAETLVTTKVSAAQLDRTPFGPEWTIGEDVPPDVPCTTDCP